MKPGQKRIRIKEPNSGGNLSNSSGVPRRHYSHSGYSPPCHPGLRAGIQINIHYKAPGRRGCGLPAGRCCAQRASAHPPPASRD
jgi:hypothetical protein